MDSNFDIYRVLDKLAQDRPVLHSEADFQFALAWKIRLLYPDAAVRLEYNPHVFESKKYIDIWIHFPNGRNVAIELKYKTKKTELVHLGERYELERHGAPANNRFLIIRDIERLERVVKYMANTSGYAIAVTNDNEYWQEWKRPKDTKDKAFRIHEGAAVSGLLKWKEDTAKSTIQSLGESLYLDGEYTMVWRDYSKGTGTTFKFLVNQVI
ncbi:hypothetical protein [Paenibacillus sp. 481]|uniref:hypothetical protein n=1 Tax=Paenibacillus sp. 481 TaxID=2835869 RepID=UPI001E56069A|nr:hypothetical protein [Paenibacillus sp. 481]UHA75414.1 hypothetical protein KIK04_10660 [Paenibacillus sp. 481]